MRLYEQDGDGSYIVLTVKREDVVEQTEYPIEKLTDEIMSRLAEDIADAIMSGGDYWIAIDEFIDNLRGWENEEGQEET
jgi:hypothetical protein